MNKFSLDALAANHLERAAEASSGRSSETVYGGHEHVLRQTLIAMLADRSMDEHASPGDATLWVLRGRVRLTAGGDSWEGRTGDMLVVPRSQHGLEALADSVVILTTAKTADPSQRS